MGTMEAIQHLYNDGGRGLGGVRRFYRGVSAAMLQAPLARFGDTAANVGALALLDDFEATRSLPVAAKTGAALARRRTRHGTRADRERTLSSPPRAAAASAAAAGFRVVLIPVDTVKTILQVEGAHGLSILRAKVSAAGPRVLWAGALGSGAATLVAHWPWFFIYNELDATLPRYDRKTELGSYLARSAAIGFAATVTSDTASNSLRVLKTTKQASKVAISYREAAGMVVEKDGVAGLFTRGLKTKIIANGVQGMLFSVLWRLGQDALNARAKDAA